MRADRRELSLWRNPPRVATSFRRISRLLYIPLITFLLTTLSCTQKYVKTDPDAPYIPTPYPVVLQMLRLADVTEKDTVYDLGCGDGRVVIAAATNFHARGVGVEIDPALVALSRDNAKRAGVADLLTFVQQDVFQTDIKEATVVALYLLPGLNTLLIPKLRGELAPGSRIVSHMHDMGEWAPDKTLRVGDSTIYLWVVPADVDGTWDISVRHANMETSGKMSIRQWFHGFQPSLSLNGRGVKAFDPVLNGASISFSTRQREAGNEQVSHYDGLVHGDLMEGQVTVTGGPAPGTYRWEARRRR